MASIVQQLQWWLLLHSYTQLAPSSSHLMAEAFVFSGLRQWCQSWLWDINKEWKKVCLCERERITARILDLALPSPTVTTVFLPPSPWALLFLPLRPSFVRPRVVQCRIIIISVHIFTCVWRVESALSCCVFSVFFFSFLSPCLFFTVWFKVIYASPDGWWMDPSP